MNHTAGELAEYLRARIHGDSHAQVVGVASPEGAKAAAWLLPSPPLRPEIHPTAIVAATARLAPNIRVGPYVVIEDEVEIGTGTAVDAFCFLGRGARVGQDCR